MQPPGPLPGERRKKKEEVNIEVLIK